MVAPATSDVTPFVFVIERSALEDRVSVSVAELFVPVESVTPDGTATDAVLTSDPVAEGLMVPVRVKVAVAPTARLTSSLIDPLPLALQVAPAEATQVQVAPVIDPGTESVTVAPVTADGPLFEATIVYVTEVPAISVVAPSVFEIARSADPVIASTSVAELSAVFVSVAPEAAATVAVFESAVGPTGEPGETVPLNVKVTLPPTATFTSALMLPVPLAGHEEPDDATHVHEVEMKFDGAVSVTVAPVAVDGPEFDTTMV